MPYIFTLILFLSDYKVLNHNVTIDGTSGCGKSSIARSIQKKLPEKVTLIKGDHMLVSYRLRCSRIFKNKKQKSDFYKNSWFNKNIKKGLKKYIKNNYETYEYKLKRKNKTGKFKIDLNKQIIIIEGCFVSQKNNFGNIADIKVFIDMDENNIKERRNYRRKINKYKYNNHKFVSRFDDIYSHYKNNYKIADKSDVKIFAYYE